MTSLPVEFSAIFFEKNWANVEQSIYICQILIEVHIFIIELPELSWNAIKRSGTFFSTPLIKSM
jgi:hypothetical protein